jgi:hypothetical protein
VLGWLRNTCDSRAANNSHIHKTIELPVTFKPRSYYRRLGIWGTLFFACITVAMTAMLLIDGDFAVAIMSATVMGSMTMIGIYLWLFSVKYALDVREKAITQTRVTTCKSMEYRDIQHAKWRNWPAGGSLQLQSSQQRMTIEFDTFEYSERAFLIAHLHTVLPREIQVDWESFFANPEKIAAAKKKTAANFYLIYSVILYLFAISFVVAWYLELGKSSVQNIVMAAVNFGFGTYLLNKYRRTPKPTGEDKRI